MKDSNKKKFNLFDWYYKGGKDNNKLDINALEKPNLANFFKLLWKKLGKLLSCNLLFIFGNFPIFFLLLALSGLFSKSVSAPLYQAWGPMYGAMGFENSTATSLFSGIIGVNTQTTVNNTFTIVLFALTLLIFFTLGFTKVGTTYIYRNMMSGEAIFPFSDFFYVIKRNKKQSLLLGFIDAFFIVMFVYNIYVLWSSYGTSPMNNFMFFFTLAMAIVYSFIRPYAYIMVFTFDLKLGKIIKNALYFIILGIKRNICALFGVLVVVLINVGIFFLFQPLGIVLPFIITISICDFIGVYTAYPVILKYMVSDEDRYKLIYKIPDDDFESDSEENIDNESTNESTEGI